MRAPGADRAPSTRPHMLALRADESTCRTPRAGRVPADGAIARAGALVREVRQNAHDEALICLMSARSQLLADGSDEGNTS
jgi:hypothetical protein